MEELGRIRLSRSFFLRDFLHSEIVSVHGICNVPDNVEAAVVAGRRLCEELLEPLQDAFGRIAIRSGYRSPAVNQLGHKLRLNCASSERNSGRHIWDRVGECGVGAMACVVVPWFVDWVGRGGSWQAMAWWVHDRLSYGELTFHPKLAAFNIGWQERPAKTIFSYTAPRGYLTKPGWANFGGDHSEAYGGFPR